jgi:hypothetical protein
MDDLTAPVIAIGLLLVVLLVRASARRHRRVRKNIEWRNALKRLRQRQEKRRDGAA